MHTQLHFNIYPPSQSPLLIVALSHGAALKQRLQTRLFFRPSIFEPVVVQLENLSLIIKANMPQSKAPRWRRKKRRKKRSVFVVARPLKMAGAFSFSSDGKFPLCHWGLFVADYHHSDVTSQLEAFLKSRDYSNPLPRGTMFELVRLSDNKISHQKIEAFGLEDWQAEWGHVAMKYIGKTELTDQDLATEGDVPFICMLTISQHDCTNASGL